MLEKRIPKRRQNIFIEEAIHARFSIMEQEKAMRELVQANKIRDEELELIDAGLEHEENIYHHDEYLNEDEMLDIDEVM